MMCLFVALYTFYVVFSDDSLKEAVQRIAKVALFGNWIELILQRFGYYQSLVPY